MAQLVLGIGSSHSPMCSMGSDDWLAWGRRFDLDNPMLYTDTGEHVTYQQRLADVGDRFLPRIDPKVITDGQRRVDLAIDRLADEIERAALDAVIVIGDDQDEHLLSSNLPPFLVYWGTTVVNRSMNTGEEHPPVYEKFLPGYLEVEGDRTYEVHSELAQHLIAEAFANHFDVATSDSLPIDTLAVGHAFGFVVRRLRCIDVPLVPVMVNTYNAPARPRATRCAALGTMLRGAIESYPDDCRVGVIASGGLSHFLVLEDLDRAVLAAFERNEIDKVTAIDESVFVAGTSEIKNWIVAAAMCADMPFTTVDYVPGYRTPAGTGTGLAFGTWKADR